MVYDVSTKYFLEIYRGAQAVMKLRPDFFAGPGPKIYSEKLSTQRLSSSYIKCVEKYDLSHSADGKNTFITATKLFQSDFQSAFS